jgi:signal transduction histidine kinase
MSTKTQQADRRLNGRTSVHRFARALFVELRCFDGVTWRLLAMTAAVMVVAMPGNHIVRAIETRQWNEGLTFMIGALIAGFVAVFAAAALANLSDRRIPLPIALAIAVAVGSLGGAFYWTQVSTQYVFALPGWGNVLLSARQIVLPLGLFASAWYFLHRAAERQKALRETELDQKRLDTGMLEARLRAMQAQVEPHFLFNTLAHIKRLYRTNPESGRLMLARFSAYVRSALPQMRESSATLGEEIELACAYLDVQRIRMDRRLNYEVRISQRLRDKSFPPMMLISLVENAIKHGLNPSREGGAIAITAVDERDTVRVIVSDTGCGFAKTQGAGVGLSNIRARLAALYGPSAQLTLNRNIPQGVIAVIEVPLRHRSDLASATGVVEQDSA